VQFATLQGAYIYGDPGDLSCHSTLEEYVCHAFPDDAYVTDQIFVGLICVAVALPVALFLERAFETANEVEGAAERWLTFGGKWRLVLGKEAHANWHWAPAADAKRAPPTELVQWLAANNDPGWTNAIRFLVPWTAKRIFRALFSRFSRAAPAEQVKQEPEAAEEEEDDGKRAAAEARAAALSRRLYSAAGLFGVYVVWTIFAWVIFTYGMLIYRNLGPEAQEQFSQTWGVGYALDNVQQWRDVCKEAVKAALLLVILDLLRVTTNRAWFEEFVDFSSTQALLFGGAAKSWWGQTALLVKYNSRVS